MDVGLVVWRETRGIQHMTSIFWRKTARCRKRKMATTFCRQVHWSLHHHFAACDWRYSSMRDDKSADWGRGRRYRMEYSQSWTGSSVASSGRADNRYKLRCSEVIRRWLRRASLALRSSVCSAGNSNGTGGVEWTVVRVSGMTIFWVSNRLRERKKNLSAWGGILQR